MDVFSFEYFNNLVIYTACLSVLEILHYLSSFCVRGFLGRRRGPMESYMVQLMGNNGCGLQYAMRSRERRRR